MRFLTRFPIHIAVALVLVLLFTFIGLPGTSSVVHAADLGDRVACWTTGPFEGKFSDSNTRDSHAGKRGFGDPEAFAVDLKDLQGFAADRSEIAVFEDAAGHPVKRRLALYRDGPDLVDHLFFLPANPGALLYTTVDDTQVQHQSRLVWGKLTAGEREERELPWDHGTGFLEGKPVARFDDGRVTSYYSRWIDPAESEGGLTTDVVAVVRDEHANAIERESGTVHFAEHGFRTNLGVQEVASTELNITLDLDCDQGVCTEKLVAVSKPVSLTLYDVVQSSNNGEEFDHRVGADVRPYVPVDSLGTPGPVEELEVHPEYVSSSTLSDRLGGHGGYAALGQRDTDSNKLRVEIELARVYRGDYTVDMGRSLGKVPLPGLGYNVWTYHDLGGKREQRLNEIGFAPASGYGPDYLMRDAEHYGFRQPILDGVYPPLGGKGSPEPVSDINWPAQLEDLNWFLYDLPGDDLKDTWSLLWIDPEGSRWLVQSGYGLSGVSYAAGSPGPNCQLTGEVVRLESIECDRGSPSLLWDEDDVQKGRGVDVYLPFETRVSGDPTRLDTSASLVMKGVASPVDVGKNPGRKMNKFAFEIEEGTKFGPETDLESLHGLDRYGAPRRRAGPAVSGATAEEFVQGWPDGPINPNLPYLMVVTFYEAYHPEQTGYQAYRHLEVAPGSDAIEDVVVPKRYLRRVLCRMLVYPSGIEPAIYEHMGWFDRQIKRVTSHVEKVWEQAKSVLANIVRGVVTFPLKAIAKGGEVACGGMHRLDSLTDVSGRSAEVEETVHTFDGRVVVNEAAKAERRGSEICYSVAAPLVPTCESGTDLIFDGYCAHLPELELVDTQYEFIDPDISGVEFYDEYQPEELEYSADLRPEDMVYKASQKLFDDVRDGPLPLEEERYQTGLTAVRVDWQNRWPGVFPGVERAIDGYAVSVKPDSKSLQTAKPGEWTTFYLPRFVMLKVEKYHINSPGVVVEDTYSEELDGFWVGGLNKHLLGAGGGDALIETPTVEDDWAVSTVTKVGLGARKIERERKRFVDFVDGMPLAPGFKHQFKVAAFNGVPDTDDYRQGNFSEAVVLSGDQAACRALEDGIVPTAELERKVNEFYGCGVAAYAARFDPLAEHRIGLLELSGTNICGDIFSSTPAALTWDNPVVKRVWALMWILAGGVLFSLLVWQGVRMTYDTWIDPQPAVGLRELVPRFLLAISLAAGSLVLARLVLVLSSDVTCFVAQMTGMSMWGVIGVTFGAIMDGTGAWLQKTDADFASLMLHEIFLRGLLTLAMAVLVFIFVFVLLYLFVKVAIGMLFRIAMLGVLIAVSPVAFALYASDTTSRWTGWWVKAFLGAACQQVFVLVVIYLGANMVASYMEDAVDGQLQVMLMGLILALLTLMLAEAVPKILNPETASAFSGAGKALGMAGMAAMVVASGAVGGVAGGAMGAYRGGRAMLGAGTRSTQPGGGDGGGSPGGGGGGGGPTPGGGGGPSSFQGLQGTGMGGRLGGALPMAAAATIGGMSGRSGGGPSSQGQSGGGGQQQGGPSGGGRAGGGVSGGRRPAGASFGQNQPGASGRTGQVGGAAQSLAASAASSPGEGAGPAAESPGAPRGGVSAGGAAPGGGESPGSSGGGTSPGSPSGGAAPGSPGGGASPGGGGGSDDMGGAARTVGSPSAPPPFEGSSGGDSGGSEGGGTESGGGGGGPVIMRAPGPGAAQGTTPGGASPGGAGSLDGGGRSTRGDTPQAPRPIAGLSFRERVSEGLRGAVTGAAAGSVSGARFGGRVNQRVASAMHGRAFFAEAARGGGGDSPRVDTPAYDPGSGHSSRETRDAVRRVARSIGRRRAR